MRALLLALCLAPACALANPVSVGLAPDHTSRLQLNGDAGFTASGLPTLRGEVAVAKSGVEVRIAPLKSSLGGQLLDNGVAAQGWHSAWDSKKWALGWQQIGWHPEAFLLPDQLGDWQLQWQLDPAALRRPIDLQRLQLVQFGMPQQGLQATR